MPEEINLKQVQEFITKNADKEEVKTYVKGFMTPDGIKTYIESDEGQKLIQPKLDTHFTKGLETWRKNNLQILIDAEVDKAVKARYPEETPEQKRLKQLEKDLEVEKSNRKKSELKMSAVREATQKGLPVDLVDYFVGQDEDSTKVGIATLEKAFGDFQRKLTDDLFKKYGRIPNRDTDSGNEGLYTKEEVSKMSQNEVRTNLDKVKKSMARW